MSLCTLPLSPLPHPAPFNNIIVCHVEQEQEQQNRNRTRLVEEYCSWIGACQNIVDIMDKVCFHLTEVPSAQNRC